MTLSETEHHVVKLKLEQEAVSRAEIASSYVNRMVDVESKGWGDVYPAMERIGSRYRLSKWTLNHLRKRRAKTVDDGTFRRIRSAYLHFCEQQISNLQHELELERLVNPDAHMEDFEREASQLLAKVREAKKTSTGRDYPAGGC